MSTRFLWRSKRGVIAAGLFFCAIRQILIPTCALAADRAIRVERVRPAATGAVGDPTASMDVNNPNGLDAEGRAALHRACSAGQTEVVRTLLDGGADVNLTDRTGATPLSFAARTGNVDVVRLLLAWHASVNAADSAGLTPLAWAAQSGRGEVVAGLLEAGAEVQATDARGMTALHYAFSRGYAEVAQTLIDRGADLKARNGQGKTPIDLGLTLNLNIPEPLLAERRESIGGGSRSLQVGVSRPRGLAWNFLHLASAKPVAREFGISATQRTAIEKMLKQCRERESELRKSLPTMTREQRRMYIADRNKIWSDALPGARAQLTDEQVRKVEAYFHEREAKAIARSKERKQARAARPDPSL